MTALAVFSFSDLLVIARAYGQRDLSRGERMVPDLGKRKRLS